jgi:hypothetical protein
MEFSRRPERVARRPLARDEVVVVVDPSELVHRAWVNSFGPGRVVSFSSASDCLAYLTLDQVFTRHVFCVVTCHRFPGDTLTGASLCSILKKTFPWLPVVLDTNCPLGATQAGGAADVIFCPRRLPVSLSELRHRVRGALRARLPSLDSA